MLPDPVGRVKSRAAGGIISGCKRYAATTTVLLGHDKLLQGRVIFQDMRDPGNPKVLKVVKVGAVPICRRQDLARPATYTWVLTPGAATIWW